MDEARLHVQLAQDKLAAARDLLAEGHLRDVVSRAYYAMYHAGQALIRSRGLESRTHRGLMHLLGREFVGSVLQATDFQDFQFAMRLRESGDYDVSFVADDDMAADLLERAGRFVATVEQTLH